MYFGNNPDPAILESIRKFQFDDDRQVDLFFGMDNTVFPANPESRQETIKWHAPYLFFLLAAIAILATTADGLADAKNKSSTPNVQVAVKGGNAATEGMVVLQSDDIDDT
ncbi:hypothetical protein GQ600_13688 [Phytophthora cactorum]|nr:hypothetical protein GQ600_13688 [Phytophthora cactorum]